MEEVLVILTRYGPALSAVGAAVAFVWTIIQFLSVRGREAKTREFEVFHRLIKELVEPPSADGSLYVDRQCAIMFELRFFPRYYPFTKRTLLGLRSRWSKLEGVYDRLIDELDITIGCIDDHPPKFQRLFKKKSY
ncbi:hypothetical protein [Hymenobacter roseosalivarius]|uniref:hypothetical protein n=1 Tax=Hymenobacter roseosalivarius TaxID=89967 RepID=UPI00117A591D|nr:hypothetical protein [Hymenobacter roseosalivarius]